MTAEHLALIAFAVFVALLWLIDDQPKPKH